MLFRSLLQRNGWIAAVQSEDSRKQSLWLTPAGRDKLEGAFPAWKEAQELVGQNLADGQWNLPWATIR